MSQVDIYDDEAGRSAYRALDILVVEDNPGDADLTLEALRAGDVVHRVRVVADGEQAITLLLAADARAGVPVPDLILLDLNLPRRTGHQVLSALRSDQRTSSVPVVILTSSDRPTDIEEAYARKANCYVTKPSDADRFIDTVRSISAFWGRL